MKTLIFLFLFFPVAAFAWCDITATQINENQNKINEAEIQLGNIYDRLLVREHQLKENESLLRARIHACPNCDLRSKIKTHNMEVAAFNQAKRTFNHYVMLHYQNLEVQGRIQEKWRERCTTRT